MTTIERLAHVGLHVNDLAVMTAFYRDILGLQVTDGDPEGDYVFMSSRPAIEHHELLLTGGRNAPRGALWLQQISFLCPSYEDVLGFFERFKENDVEFDMTVSHGNAIGIYFFDPEGNRCEVYWPTGLEAKQGFLEHLDLERPKEEVLAKVRATVEKFGATGYMDGDANARLDLQ